jgi:hypothetical protein
MGYVFLFLTVYISRTKQSMFPLDWFSWFMVDSFRGGSVMMLATISNDRKSSLVHIPGNLTAVRYRDQIIQPHLMHVIDRQRELIQQDNARPHGF